MKQSNQTDYWANAVGQNYLTAAMLCCMYNNYIQHKLYETILNIHDMLSPSLIAMSNDVILCNEIFIATNCLIMSMYSQNIDSKIVII